MNWSGMFIPLQKPELITDDRLAKSDYQGAVSAGLSGLLLRRLGPDGEGERKEPDEDLTGVHVVSGLTDVVDWVVKNNDTHV